MLKYPRGNASHFHIQEGIKELKTILVREIFCNIWTDARTTLQLKSEDVSLRHTWSGIVSSVVSYVNAEIESHRSKSKACDKNITSILREVVKTVEERKKVAGVQLPLLKRAKKIFEHVVDVLEEAGAEFATDYSHLLRTHLLIVPEYCTKLQADVFEGLCEFFVQQIERKHDEEEGYGSMDSDDLDTGVISKEGMYKSASTLNQLLKVLSFRYYFTIRFEITQVLCNEFENIERRYETTCKFDAWFESSSGEKRNRLSVELKRNPRRCSSFLTLGFQNKKCER